MCLYGIHKLVMHQRTKKRSLDTTNSSAEMERNMSINRIELQGTITRAQDYTTIKHNQDNKGMVDQSNFQAQFHKTVENKATQVHQGDNTENNKKKYDAKEKGNGEYSGDGGKKRKKDQDKDKDADGRVVLKGIGRFDMKI